MIYRFYSLILGALLSLLSFNLNGQGFSVVIDSATVQTGQTVCVPVSAKGFDAIVSFQYALTWNSQVLSFDHTQNYHLTGLSGNDFSMSPPNHLVIAWSDPAGLGVSKVDGAILYELCFIAIGPPGSSTVITADSDGLDTGYVEILPLSSTSDAPQKKVIAFHLSPNPTTSSIQVLFQSPSTGNTVLLITDALGRIVLEQKVAVNIGENRFEIPASAVNAKGMYQVSLQTKDGVSSQMLSVQ